MKKEGEVVVSDDVRVIIEACATTVEVARARPRPERRAAVQLGAIVGAIIDGGRRSTAVQPHREGDGQQGHGACGHVRVERAR